MPPVDFEAMAKTAFDSIKTALGIEGTYQPKSGGQFTIKGVFDDRVQEVDPSTQQVVVSSNTFSFGVKLDDFSIKPTKGDKVILKSTTYQVIEVQEDGVPDASAVLILHKVVTA